MFSNLGFSVTLNFNKDDVLIITLHVQSYTCTSNIQFIRVGGGMGKIAIHNAKIHSSSKINVQKQGSVGY